MLWGLVTFFPSCYVLVLPCFPSSLSLCVPLLHLFIPLPSSTMLSHGGRGAHSYSSRGLSSPGGRGRGYDRRFQMRFIEEHACPIASTTILVHSRFVMIFINTGATHSSIPCAGVRLVCIMCYSVTRVCLILWKWGKREVFPYVMFGEAQAWWGGYILLSPFCWIV